jgi:hypothetical protein
MKVAKVVSAGRDTIPASGRDALRIITDRPYLVGGEVGTETGIYVDPACPVPKPGDPVSWKGGSAWVNGVRWRRFDLEFNPAAPLH